MKRSILSLFFITSLLLSCQSDDERSFEQDPLLPVINMTNWTGHWDAICSPGQTLFFNITHKHETETFEIPADSGAFYTKDLKEGDMIRIVIQDADRYVLLSKSKEYWPQEKEVDQWGFYSQANILVCQIDRLDINGF